MPVTLKEAHDVIETHLTPRNVDPGDFHMSSPIFCSICRCFGKHAHPPIEGARTILKHDTSCYWAKCGIDHVETNVSEGKRSGMYEKYTIHKVVTRPRR